MFDFGGFNTDSPHQHKQETTGLELATSFFPWWLLLFFKKKKGRFIRNPETSIKDLCSSSTVEDQETPLSFHEVKADPNIQINKHTPNIQTSKQNKQARKQAKNQTPQLTNKL